MNNPNRWLMLVIAVLIGSDCLSAQTQQKETTAKDGGTVVNVYGSIVDETTPLTARQTITFLGSAITCVDNAGNLATECTVSGGAGAPSDATYITQTANGSLSAEQALSSLSTGIMRVATTTGVITSLTDSAGIAANISDETGTGLLVFGGTPSLTTPNIGNGATSAGYERILEDTDNGSNYLQISGQDNLAQNVTAQYATYGTSDIYADGYRPRLGFDPSTGFFDYDEFNCGQLSAVTQQGSCTNLRYLGTNGGLVNGILPQIAVGQPMTPGLVVLDTIDVDGIAAVGATNPLNMYLVDKLHGKFRVGIGQTVDPCTGTGCAGVVYVGSHDGALGTTAAPTHGIFFSATNIDSTPNWQINTCDGTCTTSSSGVALSIDLNGNTGGFTAFQTLEYYYESGVGVHFYINGTETTNSPINTHLPTTASADEFTWFNAKIARTGGDDATTHTQLVLDYAFVEGPLSR